jgi:hypothetical protein
MKNNKFLGCIFPLTLLFCICTIPFNTFSQKKNPPGTILLKKNLYIDETPVCNIEYRDYKYVLSKFLRFNLDKFEDYTNSMPDYKFETSSFFKQIDFKPDYDSLKYLIPETEEMIFGDWVDYKSYLTLPDFNYFPVINVNAEIAKSYCRWRTSMVKVLYASESKAKERKYLHNNFEYRLPTYEELKLATEKFKTEKKLKIQSAAKSDSLPSFRHLEKGGSLQKFLITNLFELVKEEDGIYETSWDTNKQIILPNLLIDNNFIRENLTFRCVCEIKDNFSN